jgi:structural maintenance of chromosome 3 (chondroitin sulfate proteoglycan 6)
LLHEGSGSAAVNAFVEVVFDNSDHRFSLEHSDEVVLRRTVGSKKDEFFLQRKRATKQEVQSLLEGAGFSKSNPYFMVQQGKIQTICLMSDPQRLALLEQVAGTTLYEDKKAESLVKMQENSQSVEKINSILQDIDTRLDELQGEKEELVLYQTADRTRKALEYTLYDKELKKARHSLDHLEHARMDHLQDSARLHESARTIHEHIQNAVASLGVKSQSLRRNRKALEHVEQDKLKALTLKTQLDLNCQELQEQIASGKETLARTEQELTKANQQIDMAQNSLKEKANQLQDSQSQLEHLLQEKDQASRKADALYAKQGRGKQYNTKEERDEFLKRQIQDLSQAQSEKRQQLQHQQDSLANLRRFTKTSQEQIVSLKTQVTQKQESLQGIRKALEEKQKNLHNLMDARKHSWRKSEELHEQTKERRITMQTAMQTVRKSMPRATAMGLKALQRIVQEQNLGPNQYFGMVLENLRLKDPKYATAVEVAAQNALFHVIVDTDATAAKLMEQLETKKLGRVTFMPLNRLRVNHNTKYPQNSNEVTCLLDMCISYDSKVEKAMQHVFDKKLLAKTAEIASQWSSRVHMDCITLDGDLCSRKGALTGGYLDQAKSRLRAYQEQRQAQVAFETVEREFQKMDSTAKQNEHDVTNASQETARLESKQSQLARAVTSLEQSLQQEEHKSVQHEKSSQNIQSSIIPPMEREIAALEGDIQRLQEEIGTELTSTLSQQDRVVLQELKQTIKTLSKKTSSQSEQVEELRSETQKLESLLQDNLLKRRQELTQVFRDEDDAGFLNTTSSSILETKRALLEDKRQQYSDANQDVNQLSQQAEQLKEMEESLKQEMIAAKQELDLLKAKDDKNLKLLDEANLESEKLMSKVCNILYNTCGNNFVPHDFRSPFVRFQNRNL